jgi:hypothetical protein
MDSKPMPRDPKSESVSEAVLKAIHQMDNPKLAMLQAIQRNMYSDAALQSIAYIILGTAIKCHPELNEKELYADPNLDDTKTDPDKFVIVAAHVGNYAPQDLIANFDKIVHDTAEVLRTAVLCGKIVAGTLRSYLKPLTGTAVDSTTHTSVALDLIWVQERNT